MLPLGKVNTSNGGNEEDKNVKMNDKRIQTSPLPLLFCQMV